MPIYHKTPSTGNSNATEIDNHTSEAAKVKRTREQAYFNSYDFDAIEVLPYANDDDEDDDDRHKNNYKRELVQQKQKQQQQEATNTTRPAFSHHHHHQQQQHQEQQQHQHHHVHNKQVSINMQPALSHSLSNASTSSDSFIDDACHHQHQQQQIVINNLNFSTKYKPTAYLQRIAGLFQPKTAKTLEHNLDRISIEAGHSNKKQHSTTEGHLCGGVGVGIAQQSVSNTTTASRNRDRDRDAPYDYVMDVTRAAKGDTNKVVNNSADTAAKVAAVDALCANVASGGNAVSNSAAGGGNFLLPRPLLKYQSSTLMPTGVAAAELASAGTSTVTSKINSMPLATHNINHSTGIKQQQQQVSGAHRPDEVHQGNSNMANVKGSEGTGIGIGVGVTTAVLRLNRTSLTSSLNSSMNFEELQEDEEEQEGESKQRPKQAKQLQEEPKVLPKTSIINPLKTSARASSHQSHYSTDKSASSGYYSSNMCSTYSMEEHIYSEPTLDLKKLKHQPLKESHQETQKPLTVSSATTLKATTLKRQQQQQQQQHQQQLQLQLQPQQHDSGLALEPFSVMRTLDCSRRYRFADNVDDLNCSQHTHTSPCKHKSPAFNENLKILESSIENLDRHLKTFPNLNSPQEGYSTQPDKQRHLPTIQEAFDSLKKPSWPPEDRSDDSLMDIDLDSFLLDKDKSNHEKALDKGQDNSTFLPEDQEENHYKCAKYINSCPEDAYRVESDILAPAHSSISGQSATVSVDLYPKRYEEQLHFENTRELLEDVRDKIRLLTQTQEAVGTPQQTLNNPKEDYIPQELHTMINTLKRELELYLARMNQHSELEIRQLCSGLVKNQHIVKMKNAFERRRSLTETNDVYATYEAIQDGIVVSNKGIPISIRQQITSIRCSSDPNFKMKRKSITEVFPMAECYVESIQPGEEELPTTTTQLQKNLSFHKPVLEQLSSGSNATTKNKTPSSGDNSDSNDKESILDWHRKKPSIWEMYYGTNRIQQSLLGVKKNGMMLTTTATSSPSTMCYPSSRPESDFTLDLPRAEQLRIKMEKEKKFRQRCRVITTFLSLVFFLLTVMVVSLVLTRGKRMFGSMI